MDKTTYKVRAGFVVVLGLEVFTGGTETELVDLTEDEAEAHALKIEPAQAAKAPKA